MSTSSGAHSGRAVRESPPSRRARWHATIAQALEILLGDRVEDRAAELARHAASAGALIEPSILAISCMAGERLLTAHAFEEALSQFERAWRVRAAAVRRVGSRDSCWPRTRAGGNRGPVEPAAGMGDAAPRDRLLRAGRRNQPRHSRCDRSPYFSRRSNGRRRTIRQIDHHTRRVARRRPAACADGSGRVLRDGRLQSGAGAFARALEISAAERDAGLELRTLAYATSVDHFDLRWSEVLAKSRRIRELARRVDDPRSETYARYRAAFALMQTGHADEATIESGANLALAEQLKDRGLLADALYVKSTLAQLKGDWREARAYSDRALALSPHQLPFLQIRLLLECETGHRKAGNACLERILAAERRAGPWPLAGAVTAIALSQIGCLWNDSTSCDAALRASRAVLERRPAIPMAQTGRVSAADSSRFTE